MNHRKVFLFVLVGVSLLSVGLLNLAAQSEIEMIEPDAGSWTTWLLDSGSQLRLDAPPDEAATADEIAQLIAMAGERDEDALQQITYWNSGPPRLSLESDCYGCAGGSCDARTA